VGVCSISRHRLSRPPQALIAEGGGFALDVVGGVEQGFLCWRRWKRLAVTPWRAFVEAVAFRLHHERTSVDSGQPFSARATGSRRRERRVGYRLAQLVLPDISFSVSVTAAVFFGMP